MADEIDHATERGERELKLRVSQRVIYKGMAEPVCTECAASIPLARQQAVPGVKLCVGCATVAEQVAQRYRA
ncbi:TraR/DksA family transcriptional regulator [Candidatus Dojkabacteria bacterium]|uniref:TraR/DksA family transcriptional regulator n=1 Tax=Candidatus Dojkabacteria bacterium TaxID=2099670 RepID=A0A5C7JC64_9BACT|nr:MAG: TraR/DksA family transcriptional regulator [Candidatus Dojkabacteria bacterium]